MDTLQNRRAAKRLRRACYTKRIELDELARRQPARKRAGNNISRLIDTG
jgi:hypothetical protein